MNHLYAHVCAVHKQSAVACDLWVNFDRLLVITVLASLTTLTEEPRLLRAKLAAADRAVSMLHERASAVSTQAIRPVACDLWGFLTECFWLQSPPSPAIEDRL